MLLNKTAEDFTASRQIIWLRAVYNLIIFSSMANTTIAELGVPLTPVHWGTATFFPMSWYRFPTRLASATLLAIRFSLSRDQAIPYRCSPRLLRRQLPSTISPDIDFTLTPPVETCKLSSFTVILSDRVGTDMELEKSFLRMNFGCLRLREKIILNQPLIFPRKSPFSINVLSVPSLPSAWPSTNISIPIISRFRAALRDNIPAKSVRTFWHENISNCFLSRLWRTGLS